MLRCSRYSSSWTAARPSRLEAETRVTDAADAESVSARAALVGSVEDLIKHHAATGGLRDEYELSQISRQLLEGLNYLHRQLHQVHRDLKVSRPRGVEPMACNAAVPLSTARVVAAG